ncbi:MAG: DUF3095 domain-containing protein [Oligoflexia bacterium]|nr:DUF3095 domain-containing protein [Oligoflexia bacterium]
MASSDRFFADMPDFSDFADVVAPAHYTDAPDDWCVAITDIRNSTAAIHAGRYKDVNALGAACIVAMVNAVPDLVLPYVFGGDGATLLFPARLKTVIEPVLGGMRRLARERFNLDLRVGVVPVAELAADGYPVQVARFRPSTQVSLAMLSGSGLTEAERRIKDPTEGPRYAVTEANAIDSVDLRGFECRWKPLPNRHGHIVSLLVQAVGASPEDRTAAYKAAVTAINDVLGDLAQANPAHAETLNIASDSAAFSQEARLCGGPAGVRFTVHQLKAAALAAILPAEYRLEDPRIRWRQLPPGGRQEHRLPQV